MPESACSSAFFAPSSFNAIHPVVGLVCVYEQDGQISYDRHGRGDRCHDVAGLVQVVFKISESANGMPCVQVTNPAPEVRVFIQSVIRSNRMDDVAYQLRTKCSAFLQCFDSSYVLVEFWNGAHAQPFVDYLNAELGNWVREMIKFDLLDYLIDGCDRER